MFGQASPLGLLTEKEKEKMNGFFPKLKLVYSQVKNKKFREVI